MNFNEHPLAGKSDIDSAFSSGWAFYKQWFIPMYAISFIMALIVSVITKNIDIAGLQNTTDLTEIMSSLKSMMGIYALTALISLFFNALLQYFIIFRPMSEEFNLTEALVKVLVKYYLPLLAIYVILSLLAIIPLLLGTLTLFVGVFFAIPYILLFFAMAAPLIMVEGPRIDRSLQSLFKLVHNKFWPNMGWISVYLVLIVFFSFIVGSLTMLPFTGSLIKSFSDPDSAMKIVEIASNPAYILLNSLATALTAPILPIIGLILYFNNSETGSGLYSDNDDDSWQEINDTETDDNDNFTPTVDDLSPKR
jgi:hypothetical protein